MILRVFNFIAEKVRSFCSANGDDRGIGVVEVILILVEKRVTGNTYVLCGN